MTIIRSKTLTTLALAALLLPAATAVAQEETAESGWSDQAEFSFVLTDGNSESSSLGFSNILTREWNRSSATVKLGGIRSDNTRTVSRFAVGTPDQYRETRVTEDETSAERYYLNGRYDRKISDAFFWFLGAGWERNRPAGINSRLNGVAGVGNIWRDDDRVTFKTDYALTYTDQEDVVLNPEASDTFAGARFSWTYQHHFGQNTTYANDLVVDQNLDDTDDRRFDMVNSLAVAINAHLALKVTLRWLYDDQPAFDEVALFDAPGGVQTGTVLIAKDELDTEFTTSLVVNF